MEEQYLVLLPSGPDTVHTSTIVLWPLGNYYTITDSISFPVYFQFFLSFS